MAPTATATAAAEPSSEDAWHLLYNPFTTTINVDQIHADSPVKLFLQRPLYAPLLFSNVTSDARDHCANERTFLSWLRLAVYMAVVSVAIFINFHLKNQPSPLEQKLSHPLGIIFWVLSLACLGSGMANYMRTVTKYAGRRALVQSGIKTQIIFGVVATAIVAACALFLGAEAQAARQRKGTS
ncbi:hypothetical protein HRR83_005986 [Exophiala dermatitidis]|uniref:DUF202 domain-containing protein n=2 Tax=Exophiala dermatitidis TaxID=5970 RepID=H6BNA1_EXODN|nr:uncharacterized protein HMPREF1120_01367 [Exophiala dermatitidis NIH/UT8656]KAJ4512035.1 hypothetical protein HRR75_004935 [Exophiala dermatitidis]EHY53169.1 hypothetical protein HMPREF1120_01367 [Exophiala dermatitidis NIH/UT8656]KAJ4514918.1 hypothetical protein HRR74_005383 [Exophiala dermatitidis]KAJ4517409.1 hypothetical protein HRR73_004461 [Exophiala dermatitidis]KAJ4548840.1 hypothetical protein HRR76_001419 [Exophiala dermatitidis]